MKPPPRVRTQRKRDCSSWSSAPEPRRRAGGAWSRAELRKLLDGLRSLVRTGGEREREEVDVVLLKERVPTRSAAEIRVMVDSLMAKVISSARFQLRLKKWEEKERRSCVEEWTHVASAAAGSLQPVISAAFSQVLIVSSTEPCTLRNCDPCRESKATVGQAVPSRAAPRTPPQGELPATVSPGMLLITTPPAVSGRRKLPAPSKVHKVPTSKMCAAQKQTSAAAAGSACQTGPDSSSQSESPAGQTAQLLPKKTPASLTSSSPKPLPSCAADPRPVPAAAQSAAAPSAPPASGVSSARPTVQRSSTAAELQAKSGPTAEPAAADDSRTFADRFAVDFEKIYKFLSVIQKPAEEFHLTPMESAIVLDLLMCLPEELPNLDCKSLNSHLIQMHRCLSAPVGSRPAEQLLSKLKDYSPSSNQRAGTAGAADSRPDGDSGRSDSAGVAPFCPPLNPFLVPVNLLMRRQSSE